jgi:uncharacterized membrane protein YdjX (TVP38/TMEM64 family)
MEDAERRAVAARKRWALVVLNECVCVAALVLFVIFLADLPLWAAITGHVVVAAAVFLGAFLPMNGWESLFKGLFTADVTVLLFLVGYIVLRRYGILDDLSDIELLKRIIVAGGPWGKLVFMLLTFLQTVILPIPSIVVSVVGTALYGPTQAFIYCTLGVMLGSVVSFYAGRLFGARLVGWICGAEKTQKYRELLNTKGRFAFILMMVFPFFPDDVLCMVAGLTTMRFRYFFVVTTLTRPVMLAVYSYLGTGSVIPFSGWGLWVWLGIFAFTSAAFVVLTKYQDKLIMLLSPKRRRMEKRGFDVKSKREL